MAKALLQPMQTVTSIAELRQSRVSRNASRFPQPPGQVYFIRHGESTSNERNIFAGVLDVELTAFGRMQARQAGLDLKRKGVQFDAVYVSHLKRARQTCDIALAVSNSLKHPKIQPQIDHRIGEKSFGIFAQRNKNLLRLALGYEGFERMLHSHDETPPSGERLELVYERSARFFEDEVTPRLERGENVLVVCHQYVLEPLALYLNQLPPAEYHHLNLPNGKALSREALVAFQEKESSGAASLRKKVNDLAIMWGVGLNAIAFLFGVTLKAIFQTTDLPAQLFSLLIVLCLAAATFYAYLDIDFAACRQKVSSTVKTVVNASMVVRWVIGLALLSSGWLYQGPEDLFKVLWLLLWLVPPALTTPVLSILWGGNLYPAALLSRNLSLMIPAVLIAVLSAVMLPISPSSLNFFYVVLALGLAVPGAIAQLWRSRSPIESNHHSKNWKFIGIFASGLMAFLTGIQLAPTGFISDIFFAVQPERSLACLQQFGLALVCFLLMRAVAVMTVMYSKRWMDGAEAQDAYILLVNPNFFLWVALVAGANAVLHQEVLEYAVFWAALGFFCIPLIEQLFFMNAFSSSLLKEGLQSTRIGSKDADQLFRQLDRDGSQTLDRGELAELLRMIEDSTTGQRNAEDIRAYVAERFFELLDGEDSGEIDARKFADYLAKYGLVVDLNAG